DVGPVAGEDVVGAAAEQKRVRMPEDLVHVAAQLLVEERHGPPAQVEAAAPVLLRPSGALHDAIQGHEGGDGESHRRPFDNVQPIGCTLIGPAARCQRRHPTPAGMDSGAGTGEAHHRADQAPTVRTRVRIWRSSTDSAARSASTPERPDCPGAGATSSIAARARATGAAPRCSHANTRSAGSAAGEVAPSTSEVSAARAAYRSYRSAMRARVCHRFSRGRAEIRDRIASTRNRSDSAK